LFPLSDEYRSPEFSPDDPFRNTNSCEDFVNNRAAAVDRSVAEAAALREALRTFERRSEEVTREHGLTSRTYTLLLMVKTGRRGPGEATPDELERRLQLAKSTVAELLERTERRGFIRRELHPQRRGAIIVKLTASGDRRIRQVCDELGAERDRLRHLLDGSNEI
jgi:DNA-binding MarR family transcriptional regulator